jgi:CheY-like chemotaxis protein
MPMSRILFLDDDPDRHHTFARNTEGHEVTHVSTYDAALHALVHDEPYDAVYLDYDLDMFGPYDTGPIISMYSGPAAFTGGSVASFIAHRLPKAKYPKKIVVHSWNDNGRTEIVTTLQRSGISIEVEIFHPNIRV